MQHRIVHWKFQPKGASQSRYTPQEGKEEGLKYIEKLREEDTVLEVIEEIDRFIIVLE